MVNHISSSTGLSALFSLHRNLASLDTSLLRLSTGRRINAGKDDPAGLIAAEQLSSEIAALDAESRSYERMNSNAAIAEGATAPLSSLYSDLKGLVVQGANTAGMSDSERDAIQMQIDTTVTSIRHLTGSVSTALSGINLPDDGNAQATTRLTDAANAAASLASGGSSSLASGNFEAAQAAIAGAIGHVSTVRGTIGAYQRNTLQTSLNSSSVALENLYAARSAIQDTNYAEETSKLALYKTTTQAGFQVLSTTQRLSGWIMDLLS